MTNTIIPIEFRPQRQQPQAQPRLQVTAEELSQLQGISLKVQHAIPLSVQEYQLLNKCGFAQVKDANILRAVELLLQSATIVPPARPVGSDRGTTSLFQVLSPD